MDSKHPAMVLSALVLLICTGSWVLLAIEGAARIPLSIGLLRIKQNRNSFANMVILRGGEKEEHNTEDPLSMASERGETNRILNCDDDENEVDDDDDDGNFGGERHLPMVNTISSIWKKTPPITQVYLGGSGLITALSFIFNKNQWPDFLHFKWSSILTGQLWRIVTAFLYFGQLDLFYPLTMQFVWQHMAQLEKLNYNKPEEFLVMLTFGAISLISVYTFLGISTKFLGHNLATFFVYIWSRVFEGSDVNFMDLFTLKSEMLPWFFCAQSLLLEREIPFADLIGILVGHVYYYLKQKNVLKTPAVLRTWFQSKKMQDRYAAFKSDFE